jgi:hypothetical protein
MCPKGVEPLADGSRCNGPFKANATALLGKVSLPKSPWSCLLRRKFYPLSPLHSTMFAFLILSSYTLSWDVDPRTDVVKACYHAHKLIVWCTLRYYLTTKPGGLWDGSLSYLHKSGCITFRTWSQRGPRLYPPLTWGVSEFNGRERQQYALECCVDPMVWGTHSGVPIRIMNGGSGEQELHELTRLKHHSDGLKTNGYYLKF